MLRRIAASILAAVAVGGGVTLAATPAEAASIGSCPNNTVCLYAGQNLAGTMIFEGNGSTMASTGHYYTSPYLQSGVQTLSSANSTLGRFCTYTKNLALSNVLNHGTSGNLANHNVYYVKIC